MEDHTSSSLLSSFLSTIAVGYTMDIKHNPNNNVILTFFKKSLLDKSKQLLCSFV